MANDIRSKLIFEADEDQVLKALDNTEKALQNIDQLFQKAGQKGFASTEEIAKIEELNKTIHESVQVIELLSKEGAGQLQNVAKAFDEIVASAKKMGGADPFKVVVDRAKQIENELKKIDGLRGGVLEARKEAAGAAPPMGESQAQGQVMQGRTQCVRICKDSLDYLAQSIGRQTKTAITHQEALQDAQGGGGGKGGKGPLGGIMEGAGMDGAIGKLKGLLKNPWVLLGAAVVGAGAYGFSRMQKGAAQRDTEIGDRLSLMGGLGAGGFGSLEKSTLYDTSRGFNINQSLQQAEMLRREVGNRNLGTGVEQLQMAQRHLGISGSEFGGMAGQAQRQGGDILTVPRMLARAMALGIDQSRLVEQTDATLGLVQQATTAGHAGNFGGLTDMLSDLARNSKNPEQFMGSRAANLFGGIGGIMQNVGGLGGSQGQQGALLRAAGYAGAGGKKSLVEALSSLEGGIGSKDGKGGIDIMQKAFENIREQTVGKGKAVDMHSKSGQAALLEAKGLFPSASFAQLKELFELLPGVGKHSPEQQKKIDDIMKSQQPIEQRQLTSLDNMVESQAKVIDTLSQMGKQSDSMRTTANMLLSSIDEKIGGIAEHFGVKAETSFGATPTELNEAMKDPAMMAAYAKSQGSNLLSPSMANVSNDPKFQDFVGGKMKQRSDAMKYATSARGVSDQMFRPEYFKEHTAALRENTLATMSNTAAQQSDKPYTLSVNTSELTKAGPVHAQDKNRIDKHKRGHGGGKRQ